MPLSPEQIAAANNRDADSPDNGITLPVERAIPDKTTPPEKVELNDPPPANPPEPSSDEPIDFSKFIDAKASIEPVPSDSTKKEESKKEIEETIQPSPIKPFSRDYSDLEDEVKPLFERMSNEAFNKLKPVYLEHKRQAEELQAIRQQLAEKSGIPDSYYEHENAHMLTPEFNQLARNNQVAQMIHNHWVQQLEQVEEGAQEFEFLGVNKEGQYEILGKVPVTAKAKADLMSYISFAQNQMLQQRAALQNYASTAKDRHSQNVNALNEMRKQFFGAFQTPENQKIYAPFIKQAKQTLPPAFRSSPLADSYAEALTLIQILGNVVKQLQGTKETKKVVKNQRNPTAAEASSEGNGSKSNDDSVTIDAFEAIKNGLPI